jgi:hypothetical protein
MKVCSHFLRSWDRASFIYSSITNKMQRYTMVFITINALHVLGGSSAHHQELKTVYTASGIRRAFSACYRLREWVGTGLHAHTMQREWVGTGLRVHSMKSYRGSRCIMPLILNLCTKLRWAASFTLRLLYPVERAPGTHWIGGLVNLLNF